MTKFALTLWVCSFIEGNACLPPWNSPVAYDSWYECSVAAHKASVTILQQMGYANVNKYNVGTKYTCRPIETL